MSVNGFGGTLVVNLPPPLPTLDFRGARVVKVLAGDTDFVSLEVLKFTAEATHPDFGRIVLARPDDDYGPSSILALAPGGHGLIERWHQALRVTVERCGDCPGPFRFRTLEPAEWTAELSRFPPPAQRAEANGASTGGTRYRMTRPIRLGAALDDAAHAEAGTCRCALGKPLSASASEARPQFARIEGLDLTHGAL
ncbi:hypothetical protein ACFVMC_27545 [Nocardia sp. NPDC127579]|uniref:hypothetical protein n=1 Tax=Nocardia sp. NPDC127579 TaxID=3345402 RepID=UPI003636F4B8